MDNLQSTEMIRQFKMELANAAEIAIRDYLRSTRGAWMASASARVSRPTAYVIEVTNGSGRYFNIAVTEKY